MIIILSPAKTLDFDTPSPISLCTQPEFLDLSHDLISGLSNLSVEQVGSLMNLSPKLAELNFNRFKIWSKKHQKGNAKQALLAFKGDVYEGLKAWEFDEADFEYAQSRLRILSGLYGLLKPLDLIQPYRLEMGTLYPNPLGKNLYEFWNNELANSISESLQKCSSKIVMNLASNEYSKAARLRSIKADIISPVFKDEKNGVYKIISFYAKRARGLMANFLISNKIEHSRDIVEFNLGGYKYCEDESTPKSPLFKRSEIAKFAA